MCVGEGQLLDQGLTKQTQVSCQVGISSRVGCWSKAPKLESGKWVIDTVLKVLDFGQWSSGSFKPCVTGPMVKSGQWSSCCACSELYVGYFKVCLVHKCKVSYSLVISLKCRMSIRM